MGTCSGGLPYSEVPGLFKLPHQQGLTQEPTTHLAPRLVVEVDAFPKTHPSHDASSAWASKAATRKLFQKPRKD